VTVDLSPASVEAVAARVVEMLREETPPATGAPAAPQLVDAVEVARRFTLTRGWVYDHAEELGAIRLGTGPRGRLRFDPAKVAEALTVCSDSRGSERDTDRMPKPKAPRRRRRVSGTERELLPIRPPGRGRS